MAYNRDAHLPLENEVNKDITDLSEQLSTVQATVDGILNGSGTALVGVPAGALTNLEQLKLDSLENADTQGQTLADLDLVVVYDASHDILRKTTLSNLYSAYLNAKITQPAGSTNQLQIKSPAGITATPNLTFKTSNNTLEVNGTICGVEMNINGSIRSPIRTITKGAYNVGEHDYTILANTAERNIIITLPPPASNSGRLLNFKKASTANSLTLLCESALIDGIDSRVVSKNNSTRTLQSDGVNWWIISKSGT